MRTNPFHRFLTKEDHLQVQIAAWLRLTYPHVIWLHPPNEGKRSKYEQYLYKQLGALSGASDMIIFHANGTYHGMALELKVVYDSGQKNYPTMHQKEFLRAMTLQGWFTAVAWDFDEAVTLIRAYLEGEELTIEHKY